MKGDEAMPYANSCLIRCSCCSTLCPRPNTVGPRPLAGRPCSTRQDLLRWTARLGAAATSLHRHVGQPDDRGGCETSASYRLAGTVHTEQ
jgi:hypothetical protein